MRCLNAFNFGSDFINWVKTFYQNIQSCTINNGLASDYFTLERGVRQGDPLSPYLFLLAIETLAVSIRKNPEIKGIKKGKYETKLLQYADDTTAILSNLNSAKILFQQLEEFKNLSGLELNTSKTEGMWIGSSKGNEETPLGINWPREPIKALGVYFTYDQTLLYEKNFHDKLDKMKRLTNIWSSRGLSIYGKVTIIKSLLIPKLVYISTLLPTPEKIIKKANHIIYTFLWKGEDKVTRLSAINNLENGGIGMIDLESMIKALRLAWLKRIFNNNENTWKSYLMYLLKDVAGPFIFQCNYAMKDLLITSLFYRELLHWWAEFRDHCSNKKDWISVIWNHKEIRIDGKPVFYKEYFKSGIYTVSDLLLHLNNIESYNEVSHKINKANFLTWTSLRHAIPSNLKTAQCYFSIGDPSFRCRNTIFDIRKNKSKDYYTLIISGKAKLPNK